MNHGRLAVPTRSRLHLFHALPLALGVASAPASGEAPSVQGANGLTPSEIAARSDAVLRGDTSHFTASMTIHSPRLPEPRVVRFESWDDATSGRTLTRILGPPRDAGMGFLKVDPNVWNFIPRVERTIRLPPSMMNQSWMGSDFTNDDLVRESDAVADYEHLLLGRQAIEKDGVSQEALKLEYRPREGSAVVWGRILAWIDAETYAPLQQEFFDEQGTAIRRLHFARFQPIQDRDFPHEWTAVPLAKPGQRTVVRVEEIRFDADLQESLFTKRQLERWR